MDFYFILSDVEGCAAASGVGNKDGYSVGCGDNDGDGTGVRPLFLIDFWSGNKRWRNTSDGDGVLFYFFWCRSGGCSSDDETYDNGNRQLCGGDFLSVNILTSASERKHDFCIYILFFHPDLFFFFISNFLFNIGWKLEYFLRK